MKISVVIGTRPEAVKMAPVILRLQKASEVECHVCATGQHREMLDEVLNVFGIHAATDLKLMQANQGLASLTARALEALDGHLEKFQPDLVLVQGDTTSVLAGGLASFYRRVPLGHVEAGLRTWNLEAPWPEEANRVLTSRLTKLHFAPTEQARANLLREGTPAHRIWVTGNTVVDALLLACDRMKGNPPIIRGLPESLQPSEGGPSRRPKVVLVTGHRRENFGRAFEEICRGIRRLSERFPDVHFVYPVHLNPNVRDPVRRLLGASPTRNNGSDRDRGGRMLRSAIPNVHLIEPLSYFPFVALMNRAELVLTDSGGVQEEAPSLGKPVLVMRETTERPEAVQAGTVRLVGANAERIVEEVSRLLTDDEAYLRMSRAHSPYGDGRAASRIVEVCRQFLENPDGLDFPVPEGNQSRLQTGLN